MTNEDKRVLEALLTDSRLSFNERGAIKDLMKEYSELKLAKSWEDPYAKAIAILEAQSRAFTGTYG